MARIREIKKIVFIESRPPDFHIFSGMPMPRLGTILLGTILKKAGYEVKIFIETLGELDLKEVLSADVVGISSITSTTVRAYETAALVKKAGIPVFMGGPHVTFMADEALGYSDFVLRGESDDYIVDFIKALEQDTGYADIPGLSYNQNGEKTHNKGNTFCKDLDTLPIPDFSLIDGYEETPYKNLTVTPIMTSRGCPYDCSFCSVTAMFGQKYRLRSNELILEELRLNKEGGGRRIFFYDDNFTADKERSKELFRSMIREGLTPTWTAQVRVETAKDEELLDLMKRSGCHTVYIGFESVNPETLKAYNKKQSFEDIQSCVKKLHKKGIRIHGMFVFGSEHDTTDTIKETLRFTKKNSLESIQFLILTPLPGTALYHEMEQSGRLISKDWSLYDAHHVLYKPKKMNFFELQNETMKAAKKFYSKRAILKQILRLDLYNIMVKSYGHNLAKKWFANNQYFIDYTKKITDAGRAIELVAKNSADDLKEKFKELEASGFLVLPHNAQKTQ